MFLNNFYFIISWSGETYFNHRSEVTGLFFAKTPNAIFVRIQWIQLALVSMRQMVVTYTQAALAYRTKPIRAVIMSETYSSWGATIAIINFYWVKVLLTTPSPQAVRASLFWG